MNFCFQYRLVECCFSALVHFKMTFFFLQNPLYICCLYEAGHPHTPSICCCSAPSVKFYNPLWLHKSNVVPCFTGFAQLQIPQADTHLNLNHIHKTPISNSPMHTSQGSKCIKKNWWRGFISRKQKIVVFYFLFPFSRPAISSPFCHFLPS